MHSPGFSFGKLTVQLLRTVESPPSVAVATCLALTAYLPASLTTTLGFEGAGFVRALLHRDPVVARDLLAVEVEGDFDVLAGDEGRDRAR